MGCERCSLPARRGDLREGVRSARSAGAPSSGPGRRGSSPGGTLGRRFAGSSIPERRPLGRSRQCGRRRARAPAVESRRSGTDIDREASCRSAQSPRSSDRGISTGTCGSSTGYGGSGAPVRIRRIARRGAPPSAVEPHPRTTPRTVRGCGRSARPERKVSSSTAEARTLLPRAVDEGFRSCATDRPPGSLVIRT
jgi:hypothetical protein